jgi:dipeptidyl aminopeptidase/acylaminoacyl peptidase
MCVVVAALRSSAVAACALLAGCAVGAPAPTTGISQTGATLRGDVYSSVSGTTEYWWRYGGSRAYGQTTPVRSVQIDDEDPHPVSEPISGLTPNTTYHFQMCARDAEESPPRTNCSADGTFSTASAIGGSRIAYASDFHDPGGLEIFAVDPDGGNKDNLTENEGSDFSPSWSPDGSKLVFTSYRGAADADIYVMDADGSDQTALTTDPAFDAEPAWSPDGSKIAFVSGRSGTGQIYVMNADGSAQTRVTTRADGASAPAWSPDGSKVAFVSGTLPDSDVYVMDADGTDQVNLTPGPGRDSDPAWSPDGSKIAFTSLRDESFDVYVMDADGSDQVSVTEDPDDSEILPAWSPDGRKLAFTLMVSGDPYGEVYVMDADGSDAVNVSQYAGPDSQPDWSPVP